MKTSFLICEPIAQLADLAGRIYRKLTWDEAARNAAAFLRLPSKPS